MKIKFFALVALLGSLVATPAMADVVTLDGGTKYSNSYDHGGMGGGRGIGFQALENFSTSSVAINVSLRSNAAQVYKFDLFSSTDGRSAGNLLKSESFNLNLGDGYQDQAFTFDFLKDAFYVLNFARADQQWLGGSIGVIYSWENGNAFDYGKLSLLEGFEGVYPNSGNPLIPHMRLTTAAATAPSEVPEPGTVALMALAMAGFALSRKNRR